MCIYIVLFIPYLSVFLLFFVFLYLSLVVLVFLFFFFFKQKTAYEMRISDWSSDVCSSDLDLGTQDVGAGDLLAVDAGRAAVLGHVADFALDRDLQVEAVAGHHHARELGVVDLDQVRRPARRAARSEERRVGKEWVSTCRSRGSQYTSKKK